MQTRDFLFDLRKLVDEELDRLITLETGVSDINEAVRYSLLAGGKRIRPLLLMAAAQAVGVCGAKFLPVACGLEMIHTYSLVHDDLPAMDDDDYRRGRLTNHKVYGEAKAILAGDALLTKAFEVMLSQDNVDSKVLVEIVRNIAIYAGDRGMVGGQTIDLEAEKNIISMDVLKKMHMAKTGALFKAAVISGGKLARADEKQLEALTLYAENYGLAFQITDDILDITGDAGEMGKNPGSDERKQKYTYISAYGLAQAQKMAEQHVAEAVEQISIFGEQAACLQYLVEMLIDRKV